MNKEESRLEVKMQKLKQNTYMSYVMGIKELENTHLIYA